MNESTRRAVRTALQMIVAAAFAVPALVAVLPTPAGRVGQITAALVAVAAIVTKIVNALEDAGVLPPILKVPTAGVGIVKGDGTGTALPPIDQPNQGYPPEFPG